MANLLAILNIIRLVPWKGIQLAVQTIINAFATKKCDCKFFQAIFKLNAAYVIVLLIRQVFDMVIALFDRKRS